MESGQGLLFLVYIVTTGTKGTISSLRQKKLIVSRQPISINLNNLIP